MKIGHKPKKTHPWRSEYKAVMERIQKREKGKNKNERTMDKTKSRSI